MRLFCRPTAIVVIKTGDGRAVGDQQYRRGKAREGGAGGELRFVMRELIEGGRRKFVGRGEVIVRVIMDKMNVVMTDHHCHHHNSSSLWKKRTLT